MIGQVGADREIREKPVGREVRIMDLAARGTSPLRNKVAWRS